ncbi:MAG: hypothetical protein A4E52_01493 [Pelotomaculum sp. PtaB.Bin013]|nr:MAG: hypothetical protein A4E52_01493 [Pelotomaculum sp. PtaB.Bin013]
MGELTYLFLKKYLRARQPKPKYGCLAVRARLETNAPPIVERRRGLYLFPLCSFNMGQSFIFLKSWFLRSYVV